MKTWLNERKMAYSNQLYLLRFNFKVATTFRLRIAKRLQRNYNKSDVSNKTFQKNSMVLVWITDSTWRASQRGQTEWRKGGGATRKRARRDWGLNRRLIRSNGKTCLMTMMLWSVFPWNWPPGLPPWSLPNLWSCTYSGWGWATNISSHSTHHTIRWISTAQYAMDQQQILPVGKKRQEKTKIPLWIEGNRCNQCWDASYLILLFIIWIDYFRSLNLVSIKNGLKLFFLFFTFSRLSYFSEFSTPTIAGNSLFCFLVLKWKTKNSRIKGNFALKIPLCRLCSNSAR